MNNTNTLKPIHNQIVPSILSTPFEIPHGESKSETPQVILVVSPVVFCTFSQPVAQNATY
jgi:hypothetical protein